MNFLEQASKEQKSFALKDGKHLVKLMSVDTKVTQKGDEYIGLTFNFQDGTKYFHNMFFHSEGAIRMCAPQLKKVMLIEKLPVYASLNDLLADRKHFLGKVELAFTALLNKKFEITAETYFSKKQNQDTQNVRLSAYLDVPNLSVQTLPTDVAPEISKASDDEKLPF